ncbi:DNA-(apurinic or apyrimidinic site) lyase /endonuclease III [Fervidobacterium changbaicum]|uniref:Endonuclease III n=1 Tax=Fervidobacterium changbaicum TaxID=310769 RepID=A0AAE6CEG7_9BACT|nr:endonuclease III [Fervidobacterium changbaicum]QAV33849.1 endonuclease III [Fervidobacterium changbaicum]SDH45465.1 DNA-(apurinic or apyrimidinic site) lyase /endonuclease III [Fervidobacterium changbaicum]
MRKKMQKASELDCKDVNRIAELIIDRFPRQHEEKDPFRVLITTILSQRSRDENTEISARNLFRVYKNVSQLANAKPEELYELIKPSGLYREKAERIVAVSRLILEKYGGKVPHNLEELVSLPGVGRKTANIVLHVSFGQPALAVDTHVHRISNRLGWVNTKTPEQTEEALKKILDPDLWGPVNGSMVEFGKQICRPISPKCELCFLTECCRYFKEKPK